MGSTSKDAAAVSRKEGAVPSGFILKLFQMVNGAPDELICWTPKGDAFKIGEDLEKLESETLPQFFRHSRFQSLVRQLNFYNFRKINRERTFWVYQHPLFHRDRPEDLHLLRRRTCPGVDGRKNRFIYTRKAREQEDKGSKKATGEVSASSDDSGDEAPKRKLPSRGRASKAKRARQIQDMEADDHSSVEENSSSDGKRRAFMTSRFSSPSKSVRSISQYDDDDSSSENVVSESAARRSQSRIVSQVAVKLEEYARKTKRGSRSGYVTPPIGGGTLPSGHYYRSVLTYDDEYEALTVGRRGRGSGIFSSAGMVTDGEESTACDDCSYSGIVSESSPTKPARLAEELFDKVPVEDEELIQSIQQRIISKGTEEGNTLASSAIAGFCMRTAPVDNGDLRTKVLQLTASCDHLALEFQQYREALHPVHRSNTHIVPDKSLSHGFCGEDQTTWLPVRDVWERAGSRRDAARDFKTLAVNYMQNLLERQAGNFDFTDDEVRSLRHTTRVWSVSTHP